MTRRKGRVSRRNRIVTRKGRRVRVGGGIFPAKEECPEILRSPKKERNKLKYSFCKWIRDRHGYDDHVKASYGPAYNRLSWIKRKLSRQPNAEGIIHRQQERINTTSSAPSSTKRTVRWSDEVLSPPLVMQPPPSAGDELPIPSNSVEKKAEESLPGPQTAGGSRRRNLHKRANIKITHKTNRRRRGRSALRKRRSLRSYRN